MKKRKKRFIQKLLGKVTGEYIGRKATKADVCDPLASRRDVFQTKTMLLKRFGGSDKRKDEAARPITHRTAPRQGRRLKTRTILSKRFGAKRQN